MDIYWIIMTDNFLIFLQSHYSKYQSSSFLKYDCQTMQHNHKDKKVQQRSGF